MQQFDTMCLSILDGLNLWLFCDIGAEFLGSIPGDSDRIATEKNFN